MKTWFLNIIYAITRFMGNLRMPYSKKLLTAEQYYHIKENIKPGDLLLSGTRGEFSNFFIPGPYTHAAVVTIPDEQPLLVEAVGKGVLSSFLIGFVMKKDYIALVRSKEATSHQAANAAMIVQGLVGHPYDYEFTSGNAAYYCSELVWFAYHKILGPKLTFTFRERYGRMTIAPMDFYRAKECWEVVWESSKTK